MDKTILIVDDDPIVRLIIQTMINTIDSSVNCHPCDNGEVGLYVLETLRNATEAIIVLLDINMPVLNGWEFLESLQNINLNSFTIFQLYIVTSSTDESDMVKAQSYSLVKKVFHKPLSKQDIEEILNSHEIT